MGDDTVNSAAAHTLFNKFLQHWGKFKYDIWYTKARNVLGDNTTKSVTSLLTN
jgi:hypothetical protein